MSDQISQRQAAEILGVHVSAVPKMVARGELCSRGTWGRFLDRAAVLALREARAVAVETRARVKAERDQEQHQQPSEPEPPDRQPRSSATDSSRRG